MYVMCVSFTDLYTYLFAVFHLYCVIFSEYRYAFMVLPSTVLVEAIHPLHWFVHLSVRSSGQLLLPRYLMNSLNSVGEILWQYSLVPTGDLARF